MDVEDLKEFERLIRSITAMEIFTELEKASIDYGGSSIEFSRKAYDKIKGKFLQEKEEKVKQDEMD